MSISIASNTRHKTERTDRLVGRTTGWATGVATTSIPIPVAARTIIAVRLTSTTGSTLAVNDTGASAFTATLTHAGNNTDVSYEVLYERGSGATLTIAQNETS